MSVSQAEQFEINEQYEEAYSEYKKSYETNPKDLNVLERLGHNALLLGKKDEAEKYYNEILALDATNTMAYEMLMDIYISTDKYKYYVSRGNLHSVNHQLEHAISDYKKALPHAEKDEQSISVYFVLGSLYEQTNNSLKAIDEYLKVLNSDDANETVYLKLSALYVKEGATQSATDILERAILHGFDNSVVKENLAGLYIREGNCERALELTSVDLTKIKCLLGLSRLDEAKIQLDLYENQSEKHPQYYSLLAEYYFTKEDYDKALECVEKFDELQKNSPLTFQMKALIYENKNDNFNSHLNWGKYNLVRGDKDVAINEYLNAYQFKNDDINLVSSLASLLEESGDKNHSAEFYERLAELDETDKTALQKLADFRAGIGDYKAQADYLEKLYQLDKRNSALILQLAKLYEKLKNKPSAVEFYEKYLSIAPESEETEKIRTKLNSLESVAMQEDEGLIGVLMKFFKK